MVRYQIDKDPTTTGDVKAAGPNIYTVSTHGTLEWIPKPFNWEPAGYAR